MTDAATEPAGVSRRGLFGAAFGRALQARFDDGRVEERPSPAVRTAGEGDSERLAHRLAPVAARVLDLAGLLWAPPRRVLVVAAGDGTPLAAAAARIGHVVTAVDADPVLVARGSELLPGVTFHRGTPVKVGCGDGTFDAVLAWFGATYHPDPRGVARELRRIAAPGGVITVSAWSRTALAALGVPPAASGHRPESWSRYETAYRQFFGLPGFDLVEGEVDGLGHATLVARMPGAATDAMRR